MKTFCPNNCIQPQLPVTEHFSQQLKYFVVWKVNSFRNAFELREKHSVKLAINVVQLDRILTWIYLLPNIFPTKHRCMPNQLTYVDSKTGSANPMVSMLWCQTETVAGLL